MPYIFAFWFATNIFEGVNLQSVADIPVHVLSQIQALLVLGLLGLQIAWFQNYTKREFWCIVVITVLLAVSMFISGIRSLFSAWLFIVASQNTDFDQIVHIAYQILFVTLLGIALLYLIHVIPDPLHYRGDRFRPSLGFVHPNLFGMHLFHIAACHCYLRRNLFRWWDFVLLLTLAAFVYIVPNSQTATVGILLTLLIMLGIRLKIRLSVWWAVVFAACLPIASVALSWIDIHTYPVLAEIDRLLSKRFGNAHIVWQRYGVTLFGNKIYVTPQERALIGLKQHLLLDNAYGYILLRFGAAVLLLFVAGYLYTIYWHGKHSHGVLVCLLLLYAIYGVEESYLQMLGCNVFLLAIAPVLYRQRTEFETPPTIYFSLPDFVKKSCDKKR